MKRLPLILLWSILLLYGCGAYVSQNIEPQEAQIGPVTPMQSVFEDIPKPVGKITAAVYKFRDQTGQYKPSETGANWSTAVTQGATTILIDVLEESGWFTPIERENLSNLLNERKIIRSSRMQYNDETPLPPLLFGGILLEGGIISYETNVMTGGAGIRYFGAGASGQYREDRVTIYLRAISTKSGEVLKTVYTSKTLLSQKVDVNLFRYVSFKRLLEVETGYTFNEPTEIAVRECIEKSVYSLIMEGAFEGLWGFADSTAMAHPTVIAYQQEKSRNLQMDYMGRILKERRGRIGIGMAAGFNLYDGDYPNALLQPAGEVNLTYNLTESLGLYANLAHGDLQTDFYRGNFTHGNLMMLWRFLPRERFTPYLAVGPGLMFEHNNTLPFVPRYRYLWKGTGIFGVEYLLNDNLGLNAEGSYNVMFEDDLDGVEQGSYNDFFYEGKVGLKYYFNLSNNKKKKESKAEKSVPNIGQPENPVIPVDTSGNNQNQ